MKYKGFEANIEYDEEDSIFVGIVINTKHSIGFHGESTAELEKNFHDLIDFHIQSVEADDKPYSGNLMLRIKPETHAQVAKSAKLYGVSINKFVNQQLDSAVLKFG
jgi:predicted HicB family RNase H-like nuclease